MVAWYWSVIMRAVVVVLVLVLLLVCVALDCWWFGGQRVCCGLGVILHPYVCCRGVFFAFVMCVCCGWDSCVWRMEPNPSAY